MRFYQFPVVQIVVATQFAIMISLTGVATLLNWDTKEVLSEMIVFPTKKRNGDADALISSATLTIDGKYALILDNNAITGTMRLAALNIDLSTNTIKTTQVITDGLLDPASIVCSPYNDAILVSCAEMNALVALKYDATNVETPLTMQGPMEILAGQAKPQLPTSIMKSNVEGIVLVEELSGVRRVQFTSGGIVTDEGLSKSKSSSDSTEDMMGCIGVVPLHK
jgi:hypothetical protein